MVLRRFAEVWRGMSLPPAYRRSPLRIACVQFDPQLGQVAKNADKVRSMTARMAPNSVDLLVLPEMALAGYMFNDGDEARAYLEKKGEGPTSQLAASLAARLRCHVIAGYPEELEPVENRSRPVGSLPPAPDVGTEIVPVGTVSNGHSAHAVGYNSAVLAGPGGVIGNYRKTFLFETDKRWAKEGDGFSYFDLPEPLGRVAIGICMDLNPKEFIAPWNAFELATFCVTNAVDVLVCPMNWLDPGEQDEEEDSDDDDPPPPRDANAPSESNLNYWAARLTPFHDPAPRYGGEGDPQKDVVFVAANRVGTERGTRFVGTSCVMTLSSNPSAIELVECCTRSEERVMRAEVT